MNRAGHPSIVIADDEPQVLTALEDQLEDMFEVHAAASGERALRLIESLGEVSVLLSDQRMPGMTGDELFARAAELCDATPVLITGFADLEAVIRAVNRGRIFGYVTKPWEREQLRLALHKAEEHHRLVRELQHERDLLRSLMNNVPDEVYFKDRECRYIRINEAGARGKGIPSVDDAIGRTDAEFNSDEAWLRHIHEEDLRALSGETVEVDDVRTRADGSRYWVSKVKAPLRDRTGTVNGIVAIARDITARKHAEAELSRFRLALDHSADIILIVERERMRHIDVNQTACQLLGYTREELLTMGPRDILPINASELESTYDDLIARPAESGMNSYYICKDGSRLPFESTRHLLKLDDKWLIAVISRDIRKRMAAEEALRQSEAGLRHAQELARLGHVITGPKGEFENWSETFPALVGVSTERVPRSTREYIRLIVPPDQPLFRDAALNAAKTRARREIEYRLERPEGTAVHVHQVMEPLGEADVEGRSRWFNTLQDVTEARAQELRIKRLARMQAMLSGINSTIVRVRTNEELFAEACRLAVETGGFRVVYIRMLDEQARALVPAASFNPTGLEIAALPLEGDEADQARKTTAGRAFLEKRTRLSNDLRTDGLRTGLRSQAVEQGILAVASLPLVIGEKAVGVITFGSAEAGLFDDEEVQLLEEVAGDIAFAIDHLEKTKRVDYLSYYDELTGLANATLFRQRLEQQLNAARHDGAQLALLVLDLERFRTVNDSLGRTAGDTLLRSVAIRISETVSDSSWVGRLNADRFAVFLPDFATVEDLARGTEGHLRQFFGAPFEVAGQHLAISGRAGIAVFPHDGADVEALSRSAEAALRKAKERRERYLFFEQRMTERVAERLSLESKLRRALRHEEFVLHYQPKVTVQVRSIVGAEALIRWQSPDLGLVPPAKFISILEETGLIVDVGIWALRRAALDHREWTESGLRPPRVAVNVSAVQMRQRNFVEEVKEAIAKGTAPTGIDLEITESLLMEDVEQNIRKLKSIQELGVNIAIDDFGTGYSSLAYLAKLPVQCLKIDRSFIITMHSDPNAMTLVTTIISLAHSLGLKVVAEGVDSEEQAKILHLLRCGEMQGYLFSKPLPAEDFTKLLRRQAGPVSSA